MVLLRNVVLVVLMSTVLVMAQQNAGPGTRTQLANKDRTREFTESFLKTMISARPIDAFAMLRSVAPESEGEIESARVTTEQLFTQVRDSYGKVIDYELLDTKSLGQSFVRYDYLLKFERNALHFRAIYYKPRNVWFPILVNFNEDLSQLFEDLAK